jgi:toluene monooxygenase system protein D
MSDAGASEPKRVGPVLVKGEAADAVIAAICELNRDVVLIDRGAYLRVEAWGRCHVSRDCIETHARRPFSLPGDLEAIMPSFRGRMWITEDQVVWSESGEARS